MIGQWYRVIFQNGDSVYFRPAEVLKNGNYRGTQISVYVDRPRARPKVKTSTIPPGILRAQYKQVPAADVPWHNGD